MPLTPKEDGTREDIIDSVTIRWMAVFLAMLLLGAPLLARPPGEGPRQHNPGDGPTQETPEERGDRFYRQRAGGFVEDGKPRPQPIDASIAAYEEALGKEPGSLRLIFKLLDALYFKGYHVVTDKQHKREIFQRLVDLTARALEQVAAGTGRSDDLDDLSLEQQAELLRAVPGAAEAHYWATASWGLWGMTHNPIKAMTRGVGSKVRDYSRLLARIDERHRDAAGLRMLGRFHTEAPKVPLITGWIDRKEGLAMLRRAVEISRREPRNLLFLAEAILEHEEDNRAEARLLLRELAARQPSPEDLVEHSESLELARALLAELAEEAAAE